MDIYDACEQAYKNGYAAGIADSKVHIKDELVIRSDLHSSKNVCNKCSKKFDLWDTQEDFFIERSLGYGTKYDGSKLNIHLCCDCMEKLIDECVVSPILDNT